MNILMVCAELAPLAKVGGLADAVSGMSVALVARGHDVRVLLPRYGEVMASGRTTEVPGDAAARHRFFEVESDVPGPRVYLLDAPEMFTDGRVYAEDERDAQRFLALCGAAVALGPTVGWRPDVFHCHDWHTALVAPMLRSAYTPPGAADAASVLSLHNIAFQGVFRASVLTECGYPKLMTFFEADELARSEVNFLRAGIRAADALVTVSPTYAREIQTPEQGMGLDALLREHNAKLTGVLNGVDYRVWHPALDPHIEHNYDTRDVSPKRRIKQALAADLGLALEGGAPLIGLVSRLAWQKGIDLLVEAIPGLLRDTDACLAVLGTGEAPLVAALRAAAAANPARVSFTEDHDEALAHRIIAGSDLVLLPSRYEPCGLTQLYAMRYGTIPVVRATGGLVDTVQPFDPATGAGTGGVFGAYEPDELVRAVRRGLEWYSDAPAWQRLVANAMQADFSWEHQAPQYEALYARLLRHRVRAPAQ